MSVPFVLCEIHINKSLVIQVSSTEFVFLKSNKLQLKHSISLSERFLTSLKINFDDVSQHYKVFIIKCVQMYIIIALVG